jgi:hypothetical protein
LPSADSAGARQKGQPQASTVSNLPLIIDSRLTDSLMGGMCIGPRPRDLLMGRMRIHPLLSDSLMCRMGINPHLSDSLMGRMRLFSYANSTVASPTFCFIFIFLEAQQHISMGLQIANTIFYEE